MQPCDLSAIEARRLIGAGKLSPVELLESCIARIEAVDHAVNAVVTRDFERARERAREAEAAVAKGEPLGPLHGLPIGIKDTSETGGLRTTFGSPIFKDHVPAADERFVALIRAAGGIVVGKTNVPEWAAGGNTRNPVFGATGNPFDPTRSAAGSSGGSAVALACGMVPLASGSDTGGSLRNPAAFCGVVGFRPSPGLIPSEKRGAAWLQVSTNGPMARTVGDAALLLSVMMGEDSRDPLSAVVPGETLRKAADYASLPEVDLSTLRVAITPDFGFAPTEHQVAQTLADKTGLFRSVFREAADTTPDCTGADDIFAVLRAVAALAMFGPLAAKHPDQLGPNIRDNIAEGDGYSARDVAEAMNAQTAMYRRWQAFYKDYDIILAPSVTISPRPWRELYPREINGQATRSYYHWLACAYAVTLPGHPAVSLPVGLDRNGLPFGLQVIGPRGGDRLTLGVAAALERHLSGDSRTARPLPDIAALTAKPALSEAEGFYAFD
ncbi:amidase [Chelatococcus asaccharovorans]|uniref:Asp-tRNA(Asn)/Glu-tRNA(Gln) amidotransferase A subunit family amidase n=1 Tax=Chelatococcus asaccharovorans TaxID=28210 RepID=A0A2V3TYY3_9HYPH|nr:amidase family protein [Chelatococcus asaccharovorans]MBS7706795.1 amidase [Chelatococcus asaccharovorans]PXW54059.1 Asp-tRNA(Asn)/Glu-tRNA(Gln) amidotransferase A subunit family amidase [Chelatococcus asaccharovorans]